MTKLLAGSKVVAAMNADTASRVQTLADKGVKTTLAIVRAGEREDEVAYERGACKRCEKVGIAVQLEHFAEDVEQGELVACLHRLNADDGVHGVLLLRPLPPHICDDAVRNELAPEKDVDGITDKSIAAVFAGENVGFAPCTAQACMEILEHYGIALAGKRAVVVGRSLVVGKPAAMMLLDRNATVTIAHSHTTDLRSVTAAADILIACVGRAQMLGADFLSFGQTVIDVGINVCEDGCLTGDVNADEASGVVAALTPVPGGVGTVTTSVLCKHVAEAAERKLG